MNSLARWLKALLGLGIALSLTIIGTITLPDLGQKPPSALAQASAVEYEIRGVWLTNVASGVLFSPWGVRRALRQLSRLHFNTVCPVVWNRGETFYWGYITPESPQQRRQRFQALFSEPASVSKS